MCINNLRRIYGMENENIPKAFRHRDEETLCKYDEIRNS